jgi:hypothetical protein
VSDEAVELAVRVECTRCLGGVAAGTLTTTPAPEAVASVVAHLTRTFDVTCSCDATDAWEWSTSP